MTLPLDSSHGGFTVGAAGGAGLTRAQAASARFAAPSRGARVRVDAVDPRRALWEATLGASAPGAVLTNASAALHWGLPLPPWLGLADDALTVVAVPPGSAHPDRRGVRGRRVRLPPEHLVEHRGLLVTVPARTWLDCAADLPVPYVVAMGDAVLRDGLATEHDLRDMVRWGRGRRGVAGARQSLPLLDPKAESPGESLVRAHVLLDGLPAPECNPDILADGVWLARVDMCWQGARLIVEYDGAGHREERQRRRDAQRLNDLQAAGWLVIVLTADDLRRPGAMVARISRALRARTP